MNYFPFYFAFTQVLWLHRDFKPRFASLSRVPVCTHAATRTKALEEACKVSLQQIRNCEPEQTDLKTTMSHINQYM